MLNQCDMESGMNSNLNEIWVPVFGYVGIYEVSSLGRIRSIDHIAKHWRGGGRLVTGKMLNPIVGSRGYPVVNLTSGGRKQHFLHKLVLESFVGPRADEQEACHNDGDRLNAAISNLRWDTRSANHKDKRAHGTWQVGEKANGAKLTDSVVQEIRSKRISVATAVSEYGLSKTNAKKIVSGKTWPHIHV